MNREEAIKEVGQLLEKGDTVLHAIKYKLDQAKIAFDEGRTLFKKEEYSECIVAMKKSGILMETIPPMILSDEPVEMELPDDHRGTD